MDIRKATWGFEKWMATHTRLVKADLIFKHRLKAESPFLFLRGTFYRWVQLWKEVCAGSAAAPRVLAVGDLHIENFGTWRDIEGRLIWGVNDFDEAYPAAYTIDLVRLATSARLACQEGHLSIRARGACDAILEGYTGGLRAGGRPLVLGERHKWLREIAVHQLHDPALFWQKMDNLPAARGRIPREVRRALEKLMPERGLRYAIKHRVAGLGSLGHQRLVAVAEWQGGHVAREAKALVPSAFVWARGLVRSAKLHYSEIMKQAVRAPDPFVRLRGDWIVRRLAPDCSRVELTSLPKIQDEARLLHSMGWETANVHLGSRTAIRAVERDLKKRSGNWLHRSAKAMAKVVIQDYRQWRKFYGAGV